MRTKQRTVSIEDNQQTINDWMIATGAEEIDMNKVAEWAIANNRWHPKPYDPVKVCAKEMSRAAREEMYFDPQGREVRKKHCYVITEPDGQRRWRWVDIVTAKPNPMRISLQSRRRSALGDILQLDTDRNSYNDNNKYGAQLEMSYNFDEDLAEMSNPTEYPEHPEDDDSRFQRAAAAFCAISLSFFLLSLAARALPPFNPPSRPSATAAGFFSG